MNRDAVVRDAVTRDAMKRTGSAGEFDPRTTTHDPRS